MPSGSGAARVLELGTGTGETARRLLSAHPGAFLVGVDESASMLSVAAAVAAGDRVDLRVGKIEEPLPRVRSISWRVRCVHHLDGPQKADLFGARSVRASAGGRFVLADVVVPVDPADATTSLTPGFDRPSPLADQVAWLRDAGFEVRVCWESGDLAVVAADAPDLDAAAIAIVAPVSVDLPS